MNKLIIHPTDFSDCSKVAFEYSLHLAELFQCELFLIHVIDYSQMKGYGQSGRLLMDRSEEIEAQSEQKLKELGELAIQQSVSCRAQLYTGSLTSILPDLIEEERPMLTVMGTVGAGSIVNKVFGSNTNSIIQTSSSPVLAIPLETKFSLPETVVLAADIQKIGDNHLNYLGQIVDALNSSLQLLYVVGEEDEEQGKSAIQEMDMKFDKLEKPIKREFKLIINDDYINGVSDHVSNERPELFSIIMSSKNFIEKFLFGSLSEKMIYQSNVPLLVLPEKM